MTTNKVINKRKLLNKRKNKTNRKLKYMESETGGLKVGGRGIG
jgi:hypothetical protein